MDRKTVLLVEDGADDERLALRAMHAAQASVDVMVANSGEQALDLINGGRVPSLIVLDLKLPGLSGHEVLSQVRSGHKTRNTPVVILSCSDDIKDVNQSYLLGANSFVRKSTDFNEFAATIEQLMHYWLNVNLADSR